EAGCDAAGERQNRTRAIGCRRAEGGGGLAYRMAEKGAGLPGGVGWLLLIRHERWLIAGLGDDSLQQCRGRLGSWRFQHLQPGGAALGISQHVTAAAAGRQMKV